MTLFQAHEHPVTISLSLRVPREHSNRGTDSPCPWKEKDTTPTAGLLLIRIWFPGLMGKPSTLSSQQCLAYHVYTINDPSPSCSHRSAISLSMQPSGSQMVLPGVLSRGTSQLGVQTLECKQLLCWKASDHHCCCNDSYSSNNSWFVYEPSFCGHDQNPEVDRVC